MPSTYTLNNGIELIGTGEQSGSWGDTTNTNLSLIDTALDGQVTVTLVSAGTSGSPNTLPISDGSTSNGRNRMVIFADSGDLGATAYVQLTPNDAEKIIYVRNDLSGSRSLFLFQGTYNASNDYEVPAGTTAVIYFDGGGAGAVAANVFNNAYFDSLRLGSVSVTAILDEDDMSSDSATSLATQQSIKAYVDTQVGANNELSEVLANGNTTGGNDINFGDSDKAIFGDGSDLQLNFNGSDGFIDNNTGNLFIRNFADDKDIIFRVDDGSGGDAVYMRLDGSNGETQIAHYGSNKLVTKSTGVDVIGTITFDGGTTSADLNFGDNDKALFGAGSDLQIYHDGTNSYIRDAGTGRLLITTDGDEIRLLTNGASEFGVRVIQDDAVKLYHNNVSRLDTTSTGVDVTGTITFDGGTTSADLNFGDNDAAVFGNSSDLTISHNVSDSRIINNTGNLLVRSEGVGDSILIQTDNGSGGLDTAARFDGSTRETVLYSNGGEKLRTKSTGVNVTGNLDASGNLYANDLYLEDSEPRITLTDSDGTNQYGVILEAAGDVFYSSRDNTSFGGHYFRAYDGTSTLNRLVINAGGDSYFYDSTGNIGMGWDAGSGRLGIGTTSPSTTLHVNSSAANFGTRLHSTDAGSYIGFSDSNTTTWTDQGIGTGSGDDIRIITGNSTRVTVNSSGSVGIGTASPSQALDVVGNIEVSGGIYLGGTAAANMLDDYEEGVWTPVIADSSSGGNAGTASSAQGEYTKIGNLVFVKCVLLNMNTTGLTSSNEFFIRNLPFATANTSVGSITMGVCLTTGGISYSGTIGVGAYDNVSSFRLSEVASNTNFDWVNVNQISSGTADIHASLTYRTNE
jgi:hypothetical protein